MGQFYYDVHGVALIVEDLQIGVLFVEKNSKTFNHDLLTYWLDAALVVGQVQFIHYSLYNFLRTSPELANVLYETLADLEVSLLVSNCLNQLVERVLVLHIPALLLELLELSLHLRLAPVVRINYPLYFLLAFLSHRLWHTYP